MYTLAMAKAQSSQSASGSQALMGDGCMEHKNSIRPPSQPPQPHTDEAATTMTMAAQKEEGKRGRGKEGKGKGNGRGKKERKRKPR